MPGRTPATSQLDWLSSTTAMIVLFWSRATRDLLKSFGWGIAALHRLDAATKLPFPRRPPHSISKRTMRRPTRQPFRGRLIRPGEMSEEYAQLLHQGSGGSMYTRKAHATREAPVRGQG